MKQSLPSNVDLCVVGAGTAGAALAGHAALRGMRVLCLDRRPLDGSGAHWVNGVGRSDFEAAGIEPPQGSELRGVDRPFHLIAGRGPQRLTLRNHGVLEVDMRLLVARLQRRATEAGATLVGGVRVRGAQGSAVYTSEGVVEARWIADAAGLRGAGLLPSRRVPPKDICAAAQAVHRIADPEGARAFLEAHEVGEDETLCFSGVAGGYSILNVRVAHGEVGLLAGSVPAEGHVSGRRLIADFVAEHSWVGAFVFGGHRPIPLGAPQPILAQGAVARLGDSAGQVFAAHGSGIAPGMVAARMLADALADGGGPDAYAVRWMRTQGGLFAAYDLFRRFSQQLSLDQLQTLMHTGLLDEASAAAGLSQVLPRPDFALVGRLPRALAECGGSLARPLAQTVAKMTAAVGLYKAYPQVASRRSAWSKLAGAL